MDTPPGRARRHTPTSSGTAAQSHRSREAEYQYAPSRKIIKSDQDGGGGFGANSKGRSGHAISPQGFGDAVLAKKKADSADGGARDASTAFTQGSSSLSSRSKNRAAAPRREKSKTASETSKFESISASAAVAAFTSSSTRHIESNNKSSHSPKDHDSSKPDDRRSKKHENKRKDSSPASSSKDTSTPKGKGDLGDSISQKDAKRTRHKSGTRSATNTPKAKRKERSSSRPRESISKPATLNLPEEAEPSNSEVGSRDNSSDATAKMRRASIPVIRLSREDSKTHREISLDDISTPDTAKRASSKRRMSAFCHAKLAFEKVAMAVTDTDPVVVTRKHSKDARHSKDRRARAHSAPREMILLNPGDRRAQSVSPASSRDAIGNEESEKSDSDDNEMQRLHLKEKDHSPKLEKTKKNKKSKDSIAEDHFESHMSSGVPTLAKKSPSAPLRFLQAITKTSNTNTNSTQGSSTVNTSSTRQPTPSRPRKKFSRGHIDQDPLEVDYEILDDRVTSLKPRPSIPSSQEFSHRVANSSSSSSSRAADSDSRNVPDRIKRPSVEEPLLPKRSETEMKLASVRETQRDQRSQSIPRPSSMPYVPSTFPRASKKQQIEHPLQDASLNNHGQDLNSRGDLPLEKASVHNPSERLMSRKAFNTYTDKQDFPSTELTSPERVPRPNNFIPLHKIPSKSSCTSSDAQSEVCLDLPDPGDQQEDDIHLHLRDPDLHVHHRDPDKFQLKHGFPSAPYRRIMHYTQHNLVLAFFSSLLTYIFSFLLLWPLLLTLLVIVPCIVLMKRLSGVFCCCCSGCSGGGQNRHFVARCCLCCCHTHLTSSELIWLGRRERRRETRSKGDRNSKGSATNVQGSPAIVQSLLVLQRGLDTDRIRRLIDSRLLSVENRHGQKLYPRFTQRVVPFCCGQAWVSMDHFNVCRHVFNMPGYIETLEDLQHFVSKMASEPLPLDAPLWEVQVLHNFREPRDTVLLFRMHLCMTDGVSMIHILENAFVDTQKTSPPKQTFSAEAVNISPFKVMFSGPTTFLSRYLFGREDFNLLHGRHVHASGEMVVAWSEPFSLSAALRVKQVARCTLTELLLSIVAGNVRSYMQVSGITNPYDVRCAVPVDFQGMDAGGSVDMENKYSVVLLPLASNVEGVIPRLWETKFQMCQFKNSAEAAIVNGARWFSYCLLPAPLFQRLWKKVYSRCTLMVSNMSGPSSVLKLDSREVKCMMYWIPPLENVPLTVSFLSYADQLRMAVMSDRSVVPNPDLLTRDFNHKLETLSKLLAHRRIPGESSSSSRHENIHLLSSFTLDDLTADQISLEMSLVQTEVHELKLQLESGPSNQISSGDTQLMARIETLKERWRELLLHLRKRKAAESESAVILADEDDLESEAGGDRHQRPFRRRTLSMSSKMSTASVSSTMRPLSTASTSNLPSPVHAALPSWPEGDSLYEDREDAVMLSQPLQYNTFSGARRGHRRAESEISSPVSNFDVTRGFTGAV
ncbi:hypothetical protein PoB_000720800 [Plakobranchus ocellatus]|uniref:Diacylglycerol O-acyltransferase n=1 Tax=Plakobranchus ocellatus TaxID=259542 RepID=A0AAV3YDY8_9GAST|nr:hypothetical protein PoB_000720800 [Plakobranchus ocellatus]